MKSHRARYKVGIAPSIFATDRPLGPAWKSWENIGANRVAQTHLVDAMAGDLEKNVDSLRFLSVR